MKPMLVGLGLLGVVAGLLPAAGTKPDEPAAQSACTDDRATGYQGKALTPLEGGHSEFHREGLLERKPPTPNGIALRIKAKQVIAKGSNQIVVDWTVSYSGSRSPLIMLKPCLSQCHRNGNTMLAILAAGKDNKKPWVLYCVWFRSPVTSFWLMPVWPAPGKDCYLTAKPGHPAKGSLRVSTEQVRRHLLKRRPEAFDREVVPKAYVKLYHEPTERGEEYGLDAWTGELESNIVPLKLSQW